MKLLEIKNLTTEFKTGQGIVKAVRNVNYSLEKGEILGIVSRDDATSISYNGETLSYEINNNSLIYYEPTYLDRSNKNECAVIKYEITCGENELNSNILKAYTYEEITMAGAWR